MDMNTREGSFVFLKASSELLNEYRKIAPNLPQKLARPLCFVVKDDDNKIWVVPITSSSIDKYQERAKKSPDRFRFYKVQGKMCCFNVSAMYPIREEDIYNVWQRKGKDVHISLKDFKDLEKHVKHLLERKSKLYAISNIQLEKLEKKYEQVQLKEHKQINSY